MTLGSVMAEMTFMRAPLDRNGGLYVLSALANDLARLLEIAVDWRRSSIWTPRVS
jgi:hypothetical protein